MTQFWHPFADMSQVSRDGEFVIDRGEGYHVFDEAGRRYVDATASLWYCNVGYGREEIAEAAAEQLRRLPAYSTFGDCANRPVIRLAERVAGYAPRSDSAVFFTSGGSDSIDTATKLVLRYWQLRGQPQRSVFVVREHAYHGMHVGGTSLAGIDANVEGYAPFGVGGTVRVPWDDDAALAEAIDRAGADRVAGFLCEPIIGAGGVLAPPPGYLSRARQLCRDSGALFLADEVVTGFARVGDWFASNRYDLDPDVIIGAKGVTSGYAPLGLLVVAPHVAEPFWTPGAGMWRHGYTYSGHATTAAIAHANLDIIEREGLIARATALEAMVRDTLAPLADHPLVTEVRAGAGVLAAVQIDPDLQAAEPGLPQRAVLAARAAGVLTRTLAGGALHVSPPLVIDQPGLDALCDGFRSALDACLEPGAMGVVEG